MSAEFTINDTAFATLEYSAELSEVLTLELADTTGIDAARVQYSVVSSSDGAPALTFSPVTGIPTVPTGPVTVTMPSSGCHSWIIQCQINEGRDANGRTQRDHTKRRGVCIRSENLDLRKWCPGETTEYDVAGWTVEQNAAVDILDAAGGGGGGGGVVSVEAPLDLDGGVLSIAPADGDSAGTMSAAHYAIVEALGDVDVEPTAETIVQRGANGEVKAIFVEAGENGAFPSQGDIRGDEDFNIYVQQVSEEARVLEVSSSTLIIGDELSTLTPQFRSAVNTGIAFRHGASLTTYFRPIPTGPCAAPGDLRFDLTTGQMYSYLQGAGEIAISSNSTIPFHKYVPDASPAEEIAEFPISPSLGRLWTLASAKIVFADVVIADDTDYARLIVGLRSSSGSSVAAIAIGATTITGSNATGDCEAYQEVTLTPQTGALTLPISATHRITFAITKHGAGTPLPPFVLTVTTKTFGS